MDNGSQARRKSSFSLLRVSLAVVVLGTISVLAIKSAANRISEESATRNEKTILHWFELATPTTRKLDDRFSDDDHDLTADPPQDPTKRRSPDVLKFSFVAGPSAETELADWKDFIDHLSQVTGKPVETERFSNNADQETALDQGSLHVTAFNTGAVPEAVATAGFIPVCTFGRDDGGFGIRMQFIVPANSPIQKLEDVKGHSIAFTTRDSNSGCKAALALLQDNDLLPQRDYQWRFSGDHEESIKGVAAGEYEVAPVASDVLARAIGAGVVKPEQFRIIYESEKFPPVTIGYAYDLTDELAGKIRQAFLDFNSRQTSLEKRFDDSGTSKFVPVSYVQDFALIRQIDSAFRKQPTPRE
jgi:phosphonate transport system substrate-binding protein